MARSFFLGLAGLVSAALFAACAAPAEDPPLDDDGADLAAAPDTRSVCSGGKARCFARITTQRSGEALRAAAPKGLGAKDLADAYKLDTSADPGATIAIVDAYGYAQAESDLKTYRTQYGLPPCTVASGCLTIVNQDGKKTPLPPAPPANDDWTLETALDLDMASAACPKCKLLLVQADDDQGDGLFQAQATAARLGATVISNSWGQSETADSPATELEHFLDLGGNVGIFVAAGDSGYDNGGDGPDYPSTSAFVTAVGGTKLTKSSSTSRGWTEKAWAVSAGNGGGGSSCSLSIPKPSWQGKTSCNFRAASDVAAVGDPASGPSVYNAANGGWVVVGGTSAATPLVAGIYALTGHGADAPSFAYGHTAAYFDVTSGTNGTCGNVLCKAGKGWDGPTGVGSPNGAVLASTH
jgi:subtilase family serine protease